MSISTATHRVGLLGTGYIADWHAKALANVPGVHVVAVCDKNISRGKAFAESHGVPEAFGSLAEMLATAKPSVVHVLLPPEFHHDASATLIDAGVHVLLEKPMCTTAAQCQALVDRAAAARVTLGVSHNFLFHDAYQRLRADVAGGVLGRIDHIGVTWAKELPQISFGPFDTWLFRQPGNVMLELGPHLLSVLLDLAGPLGDCRVRAANAITLPNGRRCFRRWSIVGDCGNAGFAVDMSLASGNPEHSVHVRGSMGSATADLERNTYWCDLPTAMDDDLDRWDRLRRQGRSVWIQSWANVGGFALSKLKLSRRGNFYGSSITAAVQAFYGGIGGVSDRRIAGDFGRDVIGACEAVISAAALPDDPAAAPATVTRGPAPGVLVLGGTGFIGRHLVGQLAARGPVRVLSRSLGKIAPQPNVQEIRGDLLDDGGLDKALDGIEVVYHLAVAPGKTWADFQRTELDATRRLAQRAMAAGVRRFVYTGTIDSYYRGPGAGVITEATPLDRHIERRNLYARAKAASETMLMAMHRDDHLPLVIVRPGVVIGAGGTIYHPGIAFWKRNGIVKFWGSGNNPLPIVLAGDVAAGMVACLDAPGIDGEAFNLVGDPCLSARDYVQELEKYAGVRFRKGVMTPFHAYAGEMLKWKVKFITRHPDRIFPCYAEWQSRTQRATFDNAKPKRMLHWHPTADRGEVIRLGIHVPADEAFA